MTQILAQAILEAALIREGSWNKDQCQQDIDAGKVIYDTEPYYSITLYDACVQANPTLAQPVYLLLTHTWNDALEWARQNYPS